MNSRSRVKEKRRPDSTGHNASLTVIFKGSDRCNAGCRFCSVGNPKGSSISEEDEALFLDELEHVVQTKKLKMLKFTFHGGEPTLLGEETIIRLCQRLRTFPVNLKLVMQSNLLNLTDSMVDTLQQNEIQVGSSVDPIGGDRLDLCGNDAFPEWVRGFLKLSSNNHPPGAIYVVTRSAIGRAREIYNIARALAAASGERFGLQINPVYAQGRAATGERELLISPLEYGQFLVDIWQIWEKSGRDISLTPISLFAECFPSPMAEPNSLSCTFNGRCGSNHIGVNYHLDVATCGRRLDSHEYLGNLKQTRLIELMDRSPERKRFLERSKELSNNECRDCPWFSLCHGGCPDDAQIATGSPDAPFPWCAAYRMLFEAMASEIKDTASARRRPRRSTRSRSQIPFRTVFSVTDVTEVPGVETTGPVSIWVLPTQDGDILRFGSGLDRCPDSLRLWIHNRQARALPMWERLLKRPGTSVALFEAAGLAAAANMINAVGGRLYLHLPSILATKEGRDEVSTLLERFISDPLWKSFVYPFSSIVQKRLRPGVLEFITPLGLSPQRFEIRDLREDTPGSMPEPIWKTIAVDAALPFDQWIVARRYCMSCNHFPHCSATLSDSGSDSCPAGAEMLIERLIASVDAMKQDALNGLKSNATNDRV